MVGLAPCYAKRAPLLPRRLQLLGSGRHDALTELPQVLTAPGEARSVLRAVIGEWSQQQADWGWLELPVMADQGWFEPEWLTGRVGERGIVLHKATRATVVLDLPSDVPALHAGFKRNLRESTRRGRNRLDRTGLPWNITAHEDPVDVIRALEVLAALHASRAGLVGRRKHPDQLAVAARRQFLGEAVAAMARRGQARILTLDVAGRPVAAQLVLDSPSWQLPRDQRARSELVAGPPADAARAARGGGGGPTQSREFNLSAGPSVSKLRWSEQVRQHPPFLVCGPRRSSRLAFTGYRMAAAVAAVRREARAEWLSGQVQ